MYGKVYKIMTSSYHRRSTARTEVLSQAMAAANAAALTESAMNALAAGDQWLERHEGSLCADCPSRLLCAAGNVALEQRVSVTANTATMQGLGVKTLPDGTRCLSNVLSALVDGRLLEPSLAPHPSDPLEEGTAAYYVDRTIQYLDHVAERLNSGQSI
jgi:hypothetical protein